MLENCKLYSGNAHLIHSLSLHVNLVVNFSYEAEVYTEISVNSGDTIGIIEYLEGNMCKVSSLLLLAIGSCIAYHLHAGNEGGWKGRKHSKILSLYAL